MNLLMVTVFLNPDGGVVFANLSMVTESLNPDGGATLSMVTVFLNPDGGCKTLLAKSFCLQGLIFRKALNLETRCSLSKRYP